MKTKLIKFSALTIFTLFLLNSCGWYKRSDIKDNPVNVDERVKRNIQEGRGFRFGSGAIIDFMPLTTVDYSGGIIITEWFSSESNTENTNRELKITVRFMTNEIRADAIKVLVFEKSCMQNNCKTKKIKSKLEGELKLAILKKATLMEKEGFQRYYEKRGKNKGKILDMKGRK